MRIIVPLASGQILIAGTADRSIGGSGLEYRTGLSRLNADGTLDRGFGGRGVVRRRGAGQPRAVPPRAWGGARGGPGHPRGDR